MTYVLLIRHAQNDWIDKKRLAGWLPGIHLNQVGIDQAKALSSRLAELSLDAVYSSPLERCLETARIVAEPHELDVVPNPDIGEVGYGTWEGKRLKKLTNKRRKWYAVQHYPSRFRFPEGESFIEVQQRAVRAVEDLSRDPDRKVFAAVTHADVIKLILAHFLGIHIDLFQRIAISPASISLLLLNPEGPVRVLRINDAGPLSIKEDPMSNGDNRSSAVHEGEIDLSDTPPLGGKESASQEIEESHVKKQR